MTLHLLLIVLATLAIIFQSIRLYRLKVIRQRVRIGLPLITFSLLAWVLVEELRGGNTQIPGIFLVVSLLISFMLVDAVKLRELRGDKDG